MDNKAQIRDDPLRFTFPRMKKKTSKTPKTAVKLKDLKPKKNAKGGRPRNTVGNTIGGT
jgi:hypothetical protein